MRRTSLLGLATALGVTAAVIITAPAVADLMPIVAEDTHWGPFFSKYHHGTRAKAVGRVREDPENGGFTYETKLYDRSPQPWLCAYVQIKTENEEGTWTRTGKKCGATGFTRLSSTVWEELVPDTITIRVCHWDKKTATPLRCGPWKLAYRYQYNK